MPGLRNILIVAMLLAVLAVPFALRPKENLIAEADETLVIISPHSEAIRYEFARAFTRYYQAQYGRTIRIDWRAPGGTSEISRYLASEYSASFEYYWKDKLRRAWTPAVQGSFDNAKVKPAERADLDSPEQAARRMFLESNVGCGIDLFFGGGSFDFIVQASAGRLVPSRILTSHPEWFGETAIPAELGGEPYYDRAGAWVGTCLSAFGICYNTDALERIGAPAPTAWASLAGPAFHNQIALADPTKSGSAAKAFEMLLQQQMQEQLARIQKEQPTLDPKEQEKMAISQGWDAGLRLIQRIAGNARYFTDAAPKVPLDVERGDAAAGMCIDFFGRFQSEAVRRPNGTSRMHYFTPKSGSSIGVDPVGLLRGAPNREAAEAFIQFVLSLEGQKLWNFKVGAPGGPEKFALRRLPIARELYAPGFREHLSDPDVKPYEEAASFQYHGAWTGPLFRQISFIVRVMCLDPHEELIQAAAVVPEDGSEAARIFTNLDGIDYQTATTKIGTVLRSNNKIEEVRLANELGTKFREQYRRAAELARSEGISK